MGISQGVLTAPQRRPRAAAHRRRRWSLLLLLPVGVVLSLGFALPLALLFVKSFQTSLGYGQVTGHLTFSAYVTAVTSPLYRRLALNALEVGAAGTVLTLLLSFPLAYFIRFRLRRGQNTVLLLIMITLFAGYIVKIYAWTTILGTYGLVNTGLERIGLIHQPLGFLLFSKLAVLIVVTYLSIPVSVLILVGSMQNVDRGLIENARDLGASGLRAVTSVLVPLAMTGIVGSLAYGFVVISGDYVTPQLVGGTTGQMIGVAISDQFVNIGDEPLGGALSFLMLAVFALVYFLLTRLEKFRGV
jgi:ABC-type spermidine/putrescine transport system permease subunit I